MKLNPVVVALLLFFSSFAGVAEAIFPTRKVQVLVNTPHNQEAAWRRLVILRGGDDSSPDTSIESAAASTDDSASAASIDDSPVKEVETPNVVKESSPALPIQIISKALSDLGQYMKGPKADTMILLLTTALNAPLCEKIGLSPILGFLGLGLLFGPNGKGLVNDIHTTEMLADLGIVLFLFEMGLHVDLKTLLGPLKKDVFGIGLTQFSLTAILIATFCKAKVGLPMAAAVIVGWSLALSSSAFVLQLLKDKDQMSTPYGKSSFGTLLLQDLMVVPLLVMTPILAGSGESVSMAITRAAFQIVIAVSTIVLFGKFAMNPLLDLASACCQEALVGMILSIVLGFSFLTEGLGLSNTLGPFLAGMLMADNKKHKHAVEKEASPFRGILVGLFFFTVGFEIDLSLIKSQFGLISKFVLGLMSLKMVLATVACLLWKSPFPEAQRVGMVLSQGGEFAFVAFRTARANGILSEKQTKILLTSVSLTMALTPLAEEVGSRIAMKLEEEEKEEEETTNKNKSNKRNVDKKK